ncbi:MAG TPA: ATP-binding protein, partial [Blastocatellia bacterium]|nr:ATP-binding protein [Blastocatellia bacterium]
MYELKVTRNPRGSEWNRWDPHLHAPGTLHNDGFAGDWDGYLSTLEGAKPSIKAAGITDYFCIQTYRQVRKWKAQGRPAVIDLVFPNVEMRLDLKTEKKKAINIHLLFSPDDPKHEAEIERLLAGLTFEYRNRIYRCTLSDLADLGRSFDPRQTDERGALQRGAAQFKVTLQNLRELWRTDIWFRKNCLVAVSGSLGDGTGGLQGDDSFAATRQEIEGFSHIIFASTPSARDFWLGKRPGHDRAVIEQAYGALKPCLNGSDAHDNQKVGNPDLERYCWINGDLTFETLRQAVIEPEERAWIGRSSPAHSQPSTFIRSVCTLDTPWLASDEVVLNRGLVAIIGAKGSGKTALVDMIATGAGLPWPSLGESSFLRRASDPVDYLGEAAVRLEWDDWCAAVNPLGPPPFLEDNEYGEQQVRYLSQHFVERLCSSAGLATELLLEMERVVFEAMESTERLETDSLRELIDVLVEPIMRRRSEMEQSIKDMSDAIVREDSLKDRLPHLRKDHEKAQADIAKARRDMTSLLPKGGEQRAKRLAELEEACSRTEAQIESLKSRLNAIDELLREVAYIRTSKAPAMLSDLRTRYARAELSDDDWGLFTLRFSGDVDQALLRAKGHINSKLVLMIDGDSRSPIDGKKTPLTGWPLIKLKNERDETRKMVGIDSEQQKKYERLHATVAQMESSARRLEADIGAADGASERRSHLIGNRRAAYEEAFATFIAEENVLRDLYSPLGRALEKAAGALAKIKFSVRRQVDLNDWVKRGEDLLDLRRNTELRGHGTLLAQVRRELAQAWRIGTAADVAKAMESFRDRYMADIVKAMPPSSQQ